MKMIWSLMANSDSSPNYVFIMIFLILSLGYLLLFLMTIYRIRSVFKSKGVISVTKCFYLLCALLCGFRLFSSMLLVVDSFDQDSQQSTDANSLTKLLYNAFYISDTIFCLMFFSLFWYLLIFQYKAHINIGAVLGKHLNPPASNRGLNWFYLLLVSYSLINLVFIGLYNASFTGISNFSELYILGSSLNNILCVLYYLIVITILKFKFSGTPAKTTKLSKELTHLEKMSYFWLFGRLFETALEIVISVNQQTISDLIIGQQQEQGIFWNVISYFILPANYIIAEIIPVLYGLLLESVGILCQEPALSKTSQQLLVEGEDEDNWSRSSSDLTPGVVARLLIKKENERNSNETPERASSEADYQQIIQVQLQNNEFFSILDKKERRKGLGYIQQISATYNLKKQSKQKAPQLLAFRTLPADAMSSWILHEINSDIKRLKMLKFKHLATVKSVAMEKDQVFLVSKYFISGSLQEMIAKKSKSGQYPESTRIESLKQPATTNNQRSPQNDHVVFKFSQQMKMRVAIDIAKTMLKLHKAGFYHGHLSSSNIFFDEQLAVKIADVGLTGLKKLMSIKQGYCNISHFTAPEHLSEEGSIVRNATSKSDSYSFAFILFELFAQKEAFEKLSLAELKKTVVVDNSRPKIPEEQDIIPKEIATIIRYCWLPNPQERPDFKIILKNLQKINNEKDEEDDDFEQSDIENQVSKESQGKDK